MVYILTVVAAAIVAAGEVVQQRSAAQAPPDDNLSWRLLLWLAQRPRWLVGVGCSLAGNLLFAAALNLGSVILVEAVFVVRLLFGLVIAALWVRHRIPGRDVAGGVVITAGLVAFLLAGDPQQGAAQVADTRWAAGAGGLVAFSVLLALVARRSAPPRKALLLGTGAGTLFGLQASLVQSAVRVLTTAGPAALLTTWNGYAVVVVALLGMLLVQSAFEVAPLKASYPAVVTAQLLAAIAVGVWVLGGSVGLGPLRFGTMLVALVAMVVGIFVLTQSRLVTHRGTAKRGSTAAGEQAVRD